MYTVGCHYVAIKFEVGLMFLDWSSTEPWGARVPHRNLMYYVLRIYAPTISQGG